ncbi:alpha/beta fold hydrolase [Ruegeria profundi]|uniref:alpha/beta fold hydrolase n=1 Tax=Ruegeria profundi TaxID=1685378 RepID=UPI001CD56576|nr:alpha/beta hydrolase [Ruegeria profundi]MCA0929617.1 alpha/beta hydrolase [Ruegeria profundi]
MTPLVLLPGMMCDARLFQPQIAALSGSRPLMTFPLSAQDSVQAMAAEVLSNAPPVFALAGLSMGGIVAMEVVRQAPERVERLALLDTNPLAEKTQVKARRGPLMAAVKAGQLRQVMRDEMKPNYLADGPDRGAILDLCMAMAMNLGADVFLRQSRALMDRPDQSETLKAYTGPALVLCGREDGLCPVERHRLMHELLPNSSLEIIEEAGHLPTLEKPDDTTAALIRWLEAI